jgi:hypothetical protein
MLSTRHNVIIPGERLTEVTGGEGPAAAAGGRLAADPLSRRR